MYMEKLDTSFIIQLQIAIIGVILVTGLFYIWRTVCRIENKLDRSQQQVCMRPKHPMDTPPPAFTTATQSSSPQPGTVNQEDFRINPLNFQGGSEEDAEAAADAIMKSVFGDVFVLSSGMVNMTPSSNGVKVTEIEEVDDDGTEDIEGDGDGEGDGEIEIDPLVETVEEDADESVATTNEDVSRISKSKLKNMNVVLLKELCSQRGLSTDGTKQTLIDRLLEAQQQAS